MATLSVSVFVIHALAGYCGTLPSVEFYQWVRAILKEFVPPLPREPGPKGGNPDPQPDRIWQIGTGTIGGLAGLGLAVMTLPETPIYTLGAAYIGGRVISDVVTGVRYRIRSRQLK